MGLTQRIINALKGQAASDRRPSPGRVVVPSADDQWRDYPSSNLTPSRLIAILREADAGSLANAMQLFEEMEEKDAHLYSVANTRRLAVTGLEWRIESAADAPDRVHADEAAAFCREVLAQLPGFDAVLQHISLATGRNIAVAELVWDTIAGQLQLADICPVDFGRLAFDDLGDLRILTEDAAIDGIELPPNKFLVHTPHSVGGHPTRGGLLRVTAMVYLAKNLALKDWLTFSEVFGMPVRIARYEPSATAEEKRELLYMLESLGANASGIFSRAVDMQIIEANRGSAGPPFEKLINFLNREISKAWLGQTLTTETPGSKGTFSASQVHEEVRKDIRADDLRKEARTIRRDVLTPLVAMQFGDRAPVPFFRRKPGKARELKELTDVLDAAVNRLGARVPTDWAHDVLGIPQAADREPVLQGAAP
ncbi:MAG: DUF935 domain-containing protein [Phycisphaerae bacterium]